MFGYYDFKAERTHHRDDHRHGWRLTEVQLNKTRTEGFDLMQEAFIKGKSALRAREREREREPGQGGREGMVSSKPRL